MTDIHEWDQPFLIPVPLREKFLIPASIKKQLNLAPLRLELCCLYVMTEKQFLSHTGWSKTQGTRTSFQHFCLYRSIIRSHFELYILYDNTQRKSLLAAFGCKNLSENIRISFLYSHVTITYVCNFIGAVCFYLFVCSRQSIEDDLNYIGLYIVANLLCIRK